jgi:hypothetical protein
VVSKLKTNDLIWLLICHGILLLQQHILSTNNNKLMMDSYRFTFLNCDLIGCKRVCRNESKYFKWLANKSGLLRECPVTWSTGHKCIVSERAQTKDVCFTMDVYLTKLECIVICESFKIFWFVATHSFTTNQITV